MNDMSHTDDEFLSSYLDGEATPEEIARIESDPTLLARVEELRAARDLIATPVTPLSPVDLDAVIGVALDASVTSPVVTGIERARERRSDRIRTIVAVAAGVLLVAIAVPVLSTISSDSGSDDTASVELDSDDDAAEDDPGDSLALEAAPADDAVAGGDDDMTTADNPAADAVDDGDADAEGATDPTATSQNRAGLYALEPVLDAEELGRAVQGRLDDYDAAAFEADELEDLETFACAEKFAFLAATDELTVVDSGVTAVGGAPTAVILVMQDATGEYLLYTTPVETCTPIAILELGD